MKNIRLNIKLLLLQPPILLTCCPGSPWLVAGHCQPPEPHFHLQGLSDLSPGLGCLPSASHYLQSGAGSYDAREKTNMSTHFEVSGRKKVCGWFYVENPPDSKDTAEVVHDAVKFVLELLQEVTCLQVELQQRHRRSIWMSFTGNRIQSAQQKYSYLWNIFDFVTLQPETSVYLLGFWYNRSTHRSGWLWCGSKGMDETSNSSGVSKVSPWEPKSFSVLTYLDQMMAR